MPSFQAVDNPELKVGLSICVHNVISDESFEVFEGEKNTSLKRHFSSKKTTKGVSTQSVHMMHSIRLTVIRCLLGFNQNSANLINKNAIFLNFY